MYLTLNLLKDFIKLSALMFSCVGAVIICISVQKHFITKIMNTQNLIKFNEREKLDFILQADYFDAWF